LTNESCGNKYPLVEKRTFAVKRPLLGVFSSLGVWTIFFSFFVVVEIVLFLTVPAAAWFLLFLGMAVFLLALVPTVFLALNFYAGDCPRGSTQGQVFTFDIFRFSFVRSGSVSTNPLIA
jgi:hypothetical protein